MTSVSDRDDVEDERPTVDLQMPVGPSDLVEATPKFQCAAANRKRDARRSPRPQQQPPSDVRRRRSLRPLQTKSKRKNKHRLPILFERAARTWWDPKFDSELLENQHWRTSSPQVRQRFQYALGYILLTAVSWCAYFAFTAREYRIELTIVCTAYAVFVVCVLALTLTPWYRKCSFSVSLVVTAVTCALSLAAFLTSGVDLEDGDGHGFETDDEGEGVAAGSDMSTIGMFAVAVQVTILIYTFIPMPLYICVLVAGVYSMSFDTLSALYTRDNSISAIVVKGLLHVCIHCIGVQVHIMTQVRMRAAWLKVGQSVLARRDLEIEKQLKERMIQSMMPPTLVDWFMREGPAEDEEVQEPDGTVRRLSSPRACHSNTDPLNRTNSIGRNRIHSLFRPFNMNRMDNVSLVFADIVGFTKMSTNKTATQVVDLLNELFGRFDVLCARHGCEKISTLGDCYYCVSGCPDPRPDHARCCVDMGLGMNVAVGLFNDDTGESVLVRVGVHTGSVLCGVLGSKRVKFDVWSYDVALANQMESTGRPGQVHVSHPTYLLTEDYYEFENGDVVKGVKTYFIVGRKKCHKGADNHMDGADTQSPLTPATTKEARGKLTSRVIMEEAELPGTTMESEDSNSPMLEHNDEGYHGTPRESWGTISSSRKDSGLPSRGSSLHTQATLDETMARPVDLLSHRVSGGYYSATSVSQPSIGMDVGLQHLLAAAGGGGVGGEDNGARGGGGGTDGDGNCVLIDPGATLCESLKRFHQLRKQSDMQLIRVLQQDENHTAEYFIHPPISQLSLSFLDEDVEREYRAHSHRQDAREATPTIASPTFNTYFDVVMSQVAYIITALACFVMFGSHILWIIFCFLATSWQMLVAALCFKQFLNPKGSSERLGRLYHLCTNWYPWHILGALLVSLPMMSILTNFSCHILVKYPLRTDFFFFTFFVSLIHFCNFTQLNCWMKSVIASFGVITVLAMLESDVCMTQAMLSVKHSIPPIRTSSVGNASAAAAVAAAVAAAAAASAAAGTGAAHSTPSDAILGSADDPLFEDESTFQVQVSFSGDDTILYEVILDMLLLLLLVLLLNREFEISYRLCFHGNLMAARDKQKIQTLKDQADWLLYNIIPKHVADHLKTTSKYSENHADVGIVFASISNFHEMYEESYRGGKEFLRVINELIVDFDELLQRTRFRNVDKIKTIGVSYMAAAGLNPQVRSKNVHPRQQLLELMYFAFSLLETTANFNRNLFEFNLILRIGYNYGSVTAGVVGTNKLYYDIWGDAVNIASRMESTGLPGSIQVPDHCVPLLQDYFEVKPRGSIYVKGKDNMNVSLVVAKKANRFDVVGHEQRQSSEGSI